LDESADCDDVALTVIGEFFHHTATSGDAALAVQRQTELVAEVRAHRFIACDSAVFIARSCASPRCGWFFASPVAASV
jgi:hypothetical protein